MPAGTPRGPAATATPSPEPTRPGPATSAPSATATPDGTDPTGETAPGFSSDDPNEVASVASFERLFAMSPRFKANLDVGHFVAANQDPRLTQVFSTFSATTPSIFLDVVNIFLFFLQLFGGGRD